MKLSIFQVDAFAETIFEGNPAAVIPLEEWLPDETMQKIALENQLSETAFYHPEDNGFALRWFTPTTEVNLCGHATLATAHVLFGEKGHPEDSLSFSTRSGILTVDRSERGYRMDFPLDVPEPAPEWIEDVSNALKAPVETTLRGREDLVAVFKTEADVAALSPDFSSIAQLETRGILATAPGDHCDFVSRNFFPKFGIDEDPVTGSAHTTLSPYWETILGKREFTARQISARGGTVYCSMQENRIFLEGHAVTFLRGEITL